MHIGGPLAREPAGHCQILFPGGCQKSTVTTKLLKYPAGATDPGEARVWGSRRVSIAGGKKRYW